MSQDTVEYPSRLKQDHYSRYLIIPKQLFRELGLTMAKDIKLLVKKDLKNPLNSDVRIVFVDPAVKNTKNSLFR